MKKILPGPDRRQVPAGGTADTTMRALGHVASAELGQPIVVENRAGAAGMIGAATIATFSRHRATVRKAGRPH